MTDRLGRADVHIHTLASDGTSGIVEILDYVEHDTSLDVIAITDHERIDAAVAAQAMRHVLVDYARSRRYAKRGGGIRPVPLDDAATVSPNWAGELIALDDALTELAALHPRQSQVVELRYFGGLSVEETAESLRVSPDTVMRDWKMAKAWLRKEVTSDK